jgi:hypothetical protein
VPEASDVLVFAEGNNQVIQRDPAAVGTLTDQGFLTADIIGTDGFSLSAVVGLSGSDLDKTATDAFTATESQTRLGINEPIDGGTLTDSAESPADASKTASDSATLASQTLVAGSSNPTDTDVATVSESAETLAAKGITASDSVTLADGPTTTADITDTGTGTLSVRQVRLGDISVQDTGLLSEWVVADKPDTGTDSIVMSESATVSAVVSHNDLFALVATAAELQGAGDFVAATEVVSVSELVTTVATATYSDSATLADVGNYVVGDDITKSASDAATFADTVDLVAVVVTVDTASLSELGGIGLHGLLSGSVTLIPDAQGSTLMDLAPKLDGVVTFLP